jgi:putative transposon-encoded protein
MVNKSIFNSRRILNVPANTKKEKKTQSAATIATTKVKFEIYGEEMIDKIVKASGNSGRVYLPPDWVGHQVKIIRVD